MKRNNIKKLVNIVNVSQKIYRDTIKNDGGSFSTHGQIANTGYMCACENLLEIPLKDFNVTLIQNLLLENWKKLSKNNIFFGTWIDNGIIYIDLSKNYKYKKCCLNLAKQLKELAIFDLNTFTSIYI